MKGFLFFAVFLLVAALLQGSVVHLPFVFVHLDLIWLVVLFLSVSLPPVAGGLVVMAIGFFQETLGAPFHGPTVLSYLLIFLFLQGFHRFIFFEEKTARFVWVALLTLAQKGIEQMLFRWQGYPAAWPFGLWFLNACLEGVFSLFLFPLFMKFMEPRQALSYTALTDGKLFSPRRERSSR